MDFSSKQALGVAVVLAIAAIVVIAATNLTKTNMEQAKKSTTDMWTQVEKQVGNVGNAPVVPGQ